MTLPSGRESETEPYTLDFEIVEKAESPFGPIPTELSAEFAGVFDGIASTTDPDFDRERFTLNFLKRNAERIVGKPIRFVHQVAKIGRILKSKLIGDNLWIRAGIFRNFQNVWIAIKKRIINSLSIGGRAFRHATYVKGGVKTFDDGIIKEVSVARRGRNPLAKIWGWISKAENAEKVSKEFLQLACMSAGLDESEANEWADVFHKALAEVTRFVKDGEDMNLETTPYYEAEELTYQFSEEDLDEIAAIPDEEVEKAVVILYNKAVWPTARVNNFPDSSFAIILPGGTRDEEGKTKPRRLRKLPFKDEKGQIDLAHLRAALSRVAQPKTKLTPEQRARARRKLLAAAKRAGVGKWRKVKKGGERLAKSKDGESGANGDNGSQNPPTIDGKDPKTGTDAKTTETKPTEDKGLLTSRDLLTKYAEAKAKEEERARIAARVKEIQEKVDRPDETGAGEGEGADTGEGEGDDKDKGDKDDKKGEGASATDDKDKGKKGETKDKTKGKEKGQKTGKEAEPQSKDGEGEKKQWETEQPEFYRWQHDLAKLRNQ